MRSATPTANMDLLPNTLKKHFLEFLDARQVIKFTSVSRQWLVMSTDPKLWNKIKEREFPDDSISSLFRLVDIEIRTAHPYLQYSKINKPDYINALETSRDNNEKLMLWLNHKLRRPISVFTGGMAVYQAVSGGEWTKVAYNAAIYSYSLRYFLGLLESITKTAALGITLYQNVQWKAEINRIVNTGVSPADVATKAFFGIIKIPVEIFVLNYEININILPESLKENIYQSKMSVEQYYENRIPSTTLALSQKFKKEQEAKPGEEDKTPTPPAYWFDKKYSLAGISLFVKKQILSVSLTHAKEMTEFLKFISP